MRAPVCLDVACGTGDVARLLASRYPDGEIHGLDLTPAMIEIARRRDESGSIHFAVGDMGRLDFPDASADLITGSYAIRNAPDLDSTLAEFARVLRPGGCAAFLDFSKPAGCFRQAIQSHLLRLWGGFWGPSCTAIRGSTDISRRVCAIFLTKRKFSAFSRGITSTPG